MHRAGERRRQVEAEAVHAHLRHPVAQRVRDQAQHLGLDHVQGVPAAGVVGVPAGVVLEAVVAAVVDALQGQGGPQLAGLGGVVVDHVEDDLDAGRVQRADHPLELADLLPRGPGGRIGRVRGEVADGVVAPVVPQTAAQQVVLVRELVHREQFHGRDAQLHQVLDRGRVRQPGVGAAQFLGDARMQPGEAADVQLVDDGVGPRGLRPAVVLPVVVIVDDDALGDVRRRVPVVAHGVGDLLLRPVPDVPVDLGRQPELAVHRACVRVQQQLRRVPAGADPGIPAAVHPIAVPLTGHHARHEAVPDLVRQFGQRNLGLPAPFVEQAEPDRFRPGGPQREVGARAPVRADPEPGPERSRRSRPHRRHGMCIRDRPVPAAPLRSSPVGPSFSGSPPGAQPATPKGRGCPWAHPAAR